MTDELAKLKTVKVVKILPTAMWVEKDILGTVHIKMQHEGEAKPFDFIQIQYNWLYTSNGHQHELTEKIMALFGVTDIKYRQSETPLIGDAR